MAMKKISLLLLVIIFALSYSGYSQLRSPSEYNQDGIDLENTYFALYESEGAYYGWASQWTQTTARTYEDRIAFFKWYFKDGTVAYTQQGAKIGDIGMITKYLLTEEAAKLKDVEGKDLQPMTLDNFPVKIELWIGASEEPEGFKPEILVDVACNKRQTIKNEYAYYFAGCGDPVK